jgi:hypothetical protein
MTGTVLDRINRDFSQFRQDEDRMDWDAALEAAAGQGFFPVAQRTPDASQHQFRSDHTGRIITYSLDCSPPMFRD